MGKTFRLVKKLTGGAFSEMFFYNLQKIVTMELI
jgi:hypothetical protein